MTTIHCLHDLFACLISDCITLSYPYVDNASKEEMEATCARERCVVVPNPRWNLVPPGLFARGEHDEDLPLLRLRTDGACAGDRAALQAEHHTVFIDPASLLPGEPYNATIRQAIAKSRLFIFLISPHAVTAGRYTLTELEFAEHKWRLSLENNGFSRLYRKAIEWLSNDITHFHYSL